MSTLDRERLSVDISHELGKRLDKIPWGLKSDVIRVLLSQFCELMEREGHMKVIYLTLDQKLKFPDKLIEKGEFKNGHSS